MENARGRTPAAGFLAQVVDGIGLDQSLGKVERLDEKKPVVIRGGERLVGFPIHRPRGRDFEHRDALAHAVVIENESMRDTSAAIVTREPESLESERAHD